MTPVNLILPSRMPHYDNQFLKNQNNHEKTFEHSSKYKIEIDEKLTPETQS